MRLRSLAQTCILAAWRRSIGVHIYVEAQSLSSHTDFGDSGWCFGADNYYKGTTSSAEVIQYEACFHVVHLPHSGCPNAHDAN